LRGIREWIREEGITQAEAARRMGLRKSNFSSLLSGAWEARTDTLLDLWEKIGGEWELHIGRENGRRS